MNDIFQAIRKVIRDRFSLNDDRADEHLIITSIRRHVDFRGANLWTLIFAILIASIGLNVNSAAVIIGAMLISPLMGPIMGVGLGIGINDFELVKKGLKNLFIAAMISVLVSACYFILTPLHEAKSELLARTSPSIWDVFIAFFGGMAGIVVGTQKEKSNVIPGVAIATALMPPLCTAGFGIATGNINYFVGALYLFFINSLFICIATFLVVRNLNFHKREFSNRQQERKVTRSILIICIATILPSLYLAYRIVKKSIFETNAKNFVQQEFKFSQTQVVTGNYLYKHDRPLIELLVIGNELSQRVIDSLEERLPEYNLANTKLIVRQGLNAKNQIDLSQIRASIIEDIFDKQKIDTIAPTHDTVSQQPIPDLKAELHALYPQMINYAFTHALFHNMQTNRIDRIVLFIGRYPEYLSRQERNKLKEWLKTRISTDSLRIIIEKE